MVECLRMLDVCLEERRNKSCSLDVAGIPLAFRPISRTGHSFLWMCLVAQFQLDVIVR